MDSIFNIIIAVLLFALMVFIHELGHFLFAKAFKIYVTEFAIGMGPCIVKKQWGDTVYRFNWIPLGGYCRFSDPEDANDNDPHHLNNAAAWKRFIVILAGGVFNMILGFIIFFSLTVGLPQIAKPVITGMTSYTNIEASGLQTGDRIVKLNNTDVHIFDDVQFFMERIDGSDVTVTAERDGKRFTAVVTPVMHIQKYIYNPDTITVEEYVEDKLINSQTVPVKDSANSEYQKLIGQSGTESRYMIGFNALQEKPSFGDILYYSFYRTIFCIKQVYISFYELIVGKIPASQVSGPIGIFSAIGTVAQQGLSTLLALFALLTINLGIVNLLPIPFLDGGRLLIIVFEGITRKKIPPEKEGKIHLIGLAIVLLLVLWGTYNDIVRLLGEFFG